MSGTKEGSGPTLPFISTAEQLSTYIPLTDSVKRDIERAARIFPLRVPKFYAKLWDPKNASCPLRKQSVPSRAELSGRGHTDPLDELHFSPTPSLVKKYPGRGVFLATATCAMYCRYCNRRRIIGTGWNPRNTWDESFYYIEKDTDLREIIVSGGDPLTLAGSDFEHVVARLRGIDHVQVIRVSTRVPVVDPDRLKSEHLETLRRYGPVWVVLHINHPQEVSPEFKGAVENLRQAGASIVSQTVLLRGVNDCPHILMRLFEALVALGVKPYYLFQLDEVKGAMHFKVSVSRGIKIVHFLRRNGSGLAVPHYAVDITGGLGKVPLDYQYMKGRNGKLLYLESLSGGKGVYADDGRGSRCLNCGVCDKPFA